MTHEHGETVALEPLHGLGQVAEGREGRTSVVLYTGNDEGVVAASDDAVLVEQKRPSIVTNASLEFLDVCVAYML